VAWDSIAGLTLSAISFNVLQGSGHRLSPYYMVGTRRKSKAAAAAATQHDYDGASTQGTDEFSHPQQFSVPLPIDIDVEALSSLIPEVSFATPTPETIVSVYRLLLAQVAETNATQRDLEEARAEVERREVELDQAYQDVENKTKSLETSLENVQSQLTVTRQEKEQLGRYSSTANASKAYIPPSYIEK
jgi:nucleoprotein TPR